MSQATITNNAKWPKSLPVLTPEQHRIRNEFMFLWQQLLPQKYPLLEQFNHRYPVKMKEKMGQRSKIKTLEVGAGIGEHLFYENLSGQEYNVL